MADLGLRLPAWIFAGMLSSNAVAAELRLPAEQENLLHVVEQTLPEHQADITQVSTTDRFVLIYAQHHSGSHVTLTLRQLPNQTEVTHLVVATDSPHQPHLERQLLTALQKAVQRQRD